MIGLAFSALAGACLPLWLDVLPDGRLVSAVAALAVVPALVLRRFEPLVAIAYMALAVHAIEAGLDAKLDPSLEGRDLDVEGVVVSIPQRQPGGVRLQLATEPGRGLPPRIELTVRDPIEPPRAGERVRGVVRLRRPRGFSNPGGADLEARLLREGIGATGYAVALERRALDWRDVARSPVLVARDSAARAIRDALGDRPATGIVAGLAVGLQDAVSREQWRALARSGTAHLMAISGMHIGMFAMAAAWCVHRLQRLRQRRGAGGSARDAAVMAGVLAAFGYSLLAGWSVPTQRTMLMIALVGVACRMRRRVGPGDALAASVLGVLALDPLAPLASGFWLSFGAVAALVLAGGGMLVGEGRLAEYARSQLAVGIGLLPVLAACFGGVSLVAPLVNLLAIPLYTLVIVPAVLFSTALACALPVAGARALEWVAGLIEWSWPLIAVPAGWPFAMHGIAALPAWCWIALCVGSLAATLPLPAAGRAAGIAMVVAACAWRPPAPCDGCTRFTLLDVGQGLAAVVETRRHVLVYDSGPAFRSSADAGAMVVAPFLQSRGLRVVDLLVASHDDSDHTGGAASIADRVPVRSLAASGSALDGLGHVARCRTGDRWRWDGVEFAWLHPGDSLAVRDNDRSCVLVVRTAQGSLLLTGDVQAPAEREIVARGLDGPVSIVVVPHHGSRTSSTPSFVAAVTPRWALVSAGYRNRWGFPARPVVERGEAAGARVLVTSRTGAIEFELGGPSVPLEPSLWRPTHLRPWADP